MEDSKTFCSSKFPWTHIRVSLNFVDNLSMFPLKRFTSPDMYCLHVQQLTDECANPEWKKWYIDYWRCDVDEPVWQERCHA